jgi:hypothetical protein
MFECHSLVTWLGLRILSSDIHGSASSHWLRMCLPSPVGLKTMLSRVPQYSIHEQEF